MFLINRWIYTNDYTRDSTILTQAITDWSANSWVDFAWAENICPEGYEAVGSIWLGTNPGN